MIPITTTDNTLNGSYTHNWTGSSLPLFTNVQSDHVFACHKGEVLRLTKEGGVKLGPGFTPDEAANEFLKLVQTQFRSMADDARRMDHLERMMPGYRKTVDDAIDLFKKQESP